MVRSLFRTFYNLIIIIFLSWGILLTFSNLPTAASTVYEQRHNHSHDGIGKYYMGREIAQVMGYTGAGWLERPNREVEEQPSKIVNLLNLKPDDVVADIGAGTGYLSFLIAPLLPQGKVLAVDIQPEMLEIIDDFKQQKKINNIEPILATLTNPNLPPESINLAIMVDAYHELAYPQEVMQGIVQALKPSGRVVLVEYRGENPLIMIKRLHKMTQKQVKKEMQTVGLVWKETKNLLPQQHFMVFEKIGLNNS
ncbi:class I SAM-dependent methyltransferase [Anabaena sp. WFMT]|uniref:class I SAM-dependent methyltransferase n=1 Tax=Anabaena sp. WFMT TaxID=3449730 RepID=UPI003F216251